MTLCLIDLTPDDSGRILRAAIQQVRPCPKLGQELGVTGESGVLGQMCATRPRPAVSFALNALVRERVGFTRSPTAVRIERSVGYLTKLT